MEPTSAWALLQRRRCGEGGLVRDSLGLSHGAGTVVEVSGPASSGKTQYALSLALQTVAGGAGGRTPHTPGPASCQTDGRTASAPSRALYLHTGPASQLAARLAAMAQGEGRLLERIWLHHLASWADLLRILDRTLPPAVRLLVLDSLPPLLVDATAPDAEGAKTLHVPGSAHTERDNKVGSGRVQLLFSLAARLKTIADSNPCLVLVVNHVVARPDSLGLDSAPVPALGLAWSSCINARLYITRTNRILRKESKRQSNSIQPVVRSIQVIFAPHLPIQTKYFIVENMGVVAVSEDELI